MVHGRSGFNNGDTSGAPEAWGLWRKTGGLESYGGRMGSITYQDSFFFFFSLSSIFGVKVLLFGISRVLEIERFVQLIGHFEFGIWAWGICTMGFELEFIHSVYQVYTWLENIHWYSAPFRPIVAILLDICGIAAANCLLLHIIQSSNHHHHHHQH